MADKEFEILLKTTADTSGIAQVKAQIAELQAQAAETSAAISGSIAGQGETKVAFDQASFTTQLEREASIRQAMLATTKEISVAQAAQVESSALIGINFSKARQEAVVLGREIATGNVRASTMGSLLGSFGTSLTIAAIAGYAVVEAIKRSGEEQQKVRDELDASSKQLDTQIKQWDELAEHATKFVDVVSIGEKGIAEMTRLMGELDKAEKSTLGTLDKIALGSERARKTPGLFREGAPPIDPNAETGAEQARLVNILKAAQGAERGIQATKDATDAADKSTKAWEADLALPPDQALDKYTAKLKDAQQETDVAKAKRDQLLSTPLPAEANAAAALVKQQNEANDALEKTVRNLEQAQVSVAVLTKRQQEHADAVQKVKDATVLLNAEADRNPELAILEKVRQKYDEVYKAQLRAFSPPVEAKAEATAESEALRRQLQTQLDIKNAAAGTRQEHQGIAAELGLERLELEKIKGDMQAIEQNPFLTLDQKNTALTQQIPQAIEKIKADIAGMKTQQANTALDPAEWVRLQGLIQRGEQEIAKFKIQLQLAASPMKQFQASLVAWVNQFGTVAQQAANIITSTLGTAINGISSAITGLIFKTQTWGQAFAQIAQSIVGNIIQIFLQLIESQIAAWIVGLVIGESSTKVANKQAVTLAASWAPAAALASTATEGGAAIAGDAAVKLAMFSTVATATALAAGGGSYAIGGYTGERGGLVHPHEFVYDAETVRRGGGPIAFENLRVAINQPNFGKVSAAPARGGKSLGGGKEIHIYNFTDRRELFEAYRNDSASEKHIIDTVNRKSYMIGGK